MMAISTCRINAQPKCLRRHCAFFAYITRDLTKNGHGISAKQGANAYLSTLPKTEELKRPQGVPGALQNPYTSITTL